MSAPEAIESGDPKGRILELDFALREAISNRAGEVAQQMTEWHGEALQQMFDPERLAADDLAFLRESCDRLRGHLERARAALDDVRAEINDLQMRRKLIGRPANSPAGRSFKA